MEGKDKKPKYEPPIARDLSESSLAGESLIPTPVRGSCRPGSGYIIGCNPGFGDTSRTIDRSTRRFYPDRYAR